MKTHKALYIWKRKDADYGVRRTLKLCSRGSAGGPKAKDNTRTNMFWSEVDCTRCMKRKNIMKLIARGKHG